MSWPWSSSPSPSPSLSPSPSPSSSSTWLSRHDQQRYAALDEHVRASMPSSTRARPHAMPHELLDEICSYLSPNVLAVYAHDDGARGRSRIELLYLAPRARLLVSPRPDRTRLVRARRTYALDAPLAFWCTTCDGRLLLQQEHNKRVHIVWPHPAVPADATASSSSHASAQTASPNDHDDDYHDDDARRAQHTHAASPSPPSRPLAATTKPSAHAAFRTLTLTLRSNESSTPRVMCAHTWSDRLLVGTSHNQLLLFDLTRGVCLFTQRAHTASVGAHVTVAPSSSSNHRRSPSSIDAASSSLASSSCPLTFVPVLNGPSSSSSSVSSSPSSISSGSSSTSSTLSNINLFNPCVASSSAASSTHITTFHADRALRVWRLSTLNCTRYLGRIGFVDRIVPLAHVHDASLFASWASDVMIWRADTLTCVRTLPGVEEIQRERSWMEGREDGAEDDEGAATTTATATLDDDDGDDDDDDDDDEAFEAPVDARTRSCTYLASLDAHHIVCAFSNGWVHVWNVEGAQCIRASWLAHPLGEPVLWCGTLGESLDLMMASSQDVGEGGDGGASAVLATLTSDQVLRVWRVPFARIEEMLDADVVQRAELLDELAIGEQQPQLRRRREHAHDGHASVFAVPIVPRVLYVPGV